MKKTVLLLMATLLAFAYTEAQTTKLQFVMWKNGVPSYNDGQILACKTKAIKGEPIPNAEIRATPANYKQAWGEASYNFLLSAPESDFTVGSSDGTEDNWGIENGVAVITGKLSPGVKVIKYKGVSIAKWGTNGCLNPLTVPVKADPVDQDNYAGNPVNNNSGKNIGGPNTGGITNTITVNPSGNQSQNSELTWSAGYAVYSNGRNDRQNDFIVDASLFKLIQDAKQDCCKGGQGGVTTAPTLYATQPQIIREPAQYATSAPTKPPFGQTFGGQLLANFLGETFGYVAGTYLVRGIDQLTHRQVVYRYNNNNQLLNTYDFQGYNQQNTVYDNTWRNINQQVTTAGNIVSAVSGNGTGLVTIGN